ncbi:MAG: EAL domain-containing protein [Pseudobutyrivibrio sp.]|nr:EAL domain-containing protein [Pseudobutyrivibrio sp.]
MAMDNHEIQAFYQPQYDATTGKRLSAEALARWIKKDGTIVSPDNFIPELEKTQDINKLDWFIAEEVCKTLKEMGDYAIPIAVNFSRWHVKEKDFTNRLIKLLNDYGISKDLFVVEITESAMAIEQDNIIRWATSLRDAGIKIAIDDFGSGLSSLQFVSEMPIDSLKIDKSLLKDNCQDDKHRIALESVFYFANRMKIETIAEGIETNEQLKFVQTCSCRKVQGYLFAKPMDKDTFMTLCQVEKNDYVFDEDILKLQSPTSAVFLLIDAIYQCFPLIIFANLSKNSYYMMTYDNFTETSCSAAGIFDELLEHGSQTMEDGYKEEFLKNFSRQSLLKAYENGEKCVSMMTRQVGNDGVHRTVEIHDYFVKSPSSKDILVICFNRNID